MAVYRRLEIEDERKTVDQAIKHGWKVRKLMFVGVRGAPDRLFGKDGRSVLIEFKRKNEVPSKQQLIRHWELHKVFGFEVVWTDDVKEACRVLGIPAP